MYITADNRRDTLRTGDGKENRMRPEDAPVHRWYRFVLSFPPHLVRHYLNQFRVEPGQTLLDPFCGTGTTLVEAKKTGVASFGIEPNPMAHFASNVKLDWSANPDELSAYAERVANGALTAMADIRVDVGENEPILAIGPQGRRPLRQLNPLAAKLLLKGSISPVPLHRSLVLLEYIDAVASSNEAAYGRLALANALVSSIGNLKFGPEVGIGHVKNDAPVVEAWWQNMTAMVEDLRQFGQKRDAESIVRLGDSRTVAAQVEPQSVDAVITSPPYPNEKDYTRTTRLESVLLGFVDSRQSLRNLKSTLLRSNTRGVYKGDSDDLEVATNAEVQSIAQKIEQRRIELRKTSGFERMYPRVARLYFGGMSKHLASLRRVLRPGAQLAYIVGDQASYLRVKIRTGQLLAGIAESLGYQVTDIDLFRTRPSTATGEQLREEVLLLRWPGS